MSSKKTLAEYQIVNRRMFEGTENAIFGDLYQTCCSDSCTPWAAARRASANNSSSSLVICELPGVECNVGGMVEVLSMKGLELRCSVEDLFERVSMLKALVHLDLSENMDLDGSFLEEGSSVCSPVRNGLQKLSMSRTSTEGGLPICLFEPESSLKELYMSDTLVSSLQENIFAPQSPLEVLQIDDSELVGRMPSSLGFLQSLRIVDLSRNQISGQIPEFASDHLESVDFSSNKLTGAVPHALATHPSLLKLHVSDNNLTELPVEWVQMVYTESSGIAFPLEDVDVSENSIAGPFPSGLAFYPSLRTLEVANNMLQGELEDFPRGFPSLQTLDISNNRLSGGYPDWLLNVPQVRSIRSGLVSSQSSSTAPDASSGLSGGAIAGIVIGTLAGVALLGLLAHRLYAHRRKFSAAVSSRRPTVFQNGGSKFQRFEDDPNAIEIV